MAFAFEISRAARRACIRAEGRIDLETSLAAGYRLARDPRIGDDFHVLIDMRGSSWKLSCEEAMDLATAVAQMPRQEGKVALLVNQVGLAQARIFCDLAAAHGFDVMPFERTEDAHRWLSIGRSVQ
jgi:hypothetical protein